MLVNMVLHYVGKLMLLEVMVKTIHSFQIMLAFQVLLLLG
jgi:hypothetical protein